MVTWLHDQRAALMARIRTVKPDFWGSPKTAKVCRDARLLFLGLLNLADDDGRLLASPKAIAGNVFPHDDDVDAKQITDWMTELVRASFVQLYTGDGIGYCQIDGFGEHQRVSHPTPSKFPPPPTKTAGQTGQETFANDSGEPPENFGPEVEQGTGNREQGSVVPTLPVRPGASWVERVDPAGPLAIRGHCTNVLDLATAQAQGTIPVTPSDRRTLRPVIEEALRSGYAIDDLANAVATAAFRTKNGVMGELRKSKQQPTSVGNRGIPAVGRFLEGEGA